MSIINNMPVKGGMDINGLIEEYYVYAGENVSAGDFVEFVEGVGSATTKSASNVLLHNGVYGGNSHAAVVSDNHVILFYKSENQTFSADIINIQDGVITKLNSTVLDSDQESASQFDIVKINDNTIFVAHSSSSNAVYGMIVTINGTTVTVARNTSLVSGNNADYRIEITLLSPEKVFISHTYPSSYKGVNGIVCTISGTSISKGTDTSIYSISVNDDLEVRDCTTLTSGSVFYSYTRYNGTTSYTTDAYGVICNISGTAISKGTPVLLKQNNGNAKIKIMQSNDNKALVFLQKTNLYSLTQILCTIDNTNITISYETLYESVSARNFSIARIKENEYLILYQKYSSPYGLNGFILSVNNNLIICNTNVQLDTTSGICNGMGDAIILNNNDILAFYGIYYSDTTYSRLVGIDNINNVPTNTIVLSENYETQVRNTTTNASNGVAKVGGEGGSSILHKDKIQVYVPNI